MRKMYDGFLLALQLLTTIPVRSNVPWDEERACWSVRFFPVIGLVLGSALVIQYWLLTIFTPVSYMFLSLWLLFFSVIFSGGLHLDGWMDCSDAYFSYRNRQSRHEIMSDPRVGAFAVIAVIFLLAFRFMFIYEAINGFFNVIFFIVVPFLSRSFMALLLIKGQLAKPNGMAAAFREHVHSGDAYFVTGTMLVIICTAVVLAGKNVALSICVLTIAAAICYVCFNQFFNKEFGGITGDTLGAFVEGVETVLWFTIWLLHFFVTV